MGVEVATLPERSPPGTITAHTPRRRVAKTQNARGNRAAGCCPIAVELRTCAHELPPCSILATVAPLKWMNRFERVAMK